METIVGGRIGDRMEMEKSTTVGCNIHCMLKWMGERTRERREHGEQDGERKSIGRGMD